MTCSVLTSGVRCNNHPCTALKGLGGSPDESSEEFCSFSNLPVTSSTSQLILQPFCRFTYVHSSFSNPSVASPTSQFILQPFFRFSYVTSSSLNSPGEPPMLKGTFRYLTRKTLCITPAVLRYFVCEHIKMNKKWKQCYIFNCYSKTVIGCLRSLTLQQ